MVFGAAVDTLKQNLTQLENAAAAAPSDQSVVAAAASKSSAAKTTSRTHGAIAASGVGASGANVNIKGVYSPSAAPSGHGDLGDFIGLTSMLLL